MFIAIEGIDGAGKTSVSKMIANNLGYEYSSQKALSSYMSIEENVYLEYCHNYREQVCSDHTSMFMLYSLSCFLSGRKPNVVCDRHLPTVYFWYGNETSLIVAETIYRISKKPDITFLLNVGVDTATERIRKKWLNGEITEHEYSRDLIKAKSASNFVQEVIPFLYHFNLKYVIIDANEKSLADVVSEIMLMIGKTKFLLPT